MEVFVTFFGSIVLELVQLLGFAVAYVLGGALKESVRPDSEASWWLAFLGHLFGGVLIGALSVLVLPGSFGGSLPLPGASLVLAPLLVGTVVSWLGRSRCADGQRPVYLTFRGGATFALGVAVARFARHRFGG